MDSPENRQIGVLDIAPRLRGLTFDGEKGAIVHFSDHLLSAQRTSELGGISVDLGGVEATEAAARLTEAFEAPRPDSPGRLVPAVVVCRPLGSFYLAESYDRALALQSAAESGAAAPSAPQTLQGGAEPGAAHLQSPDSAVEAVIDRNRVVENKISVVTGGAQGFGAEIVRLLAAAGSLVFIADLNAEGASALADELNEKQGRTCALSAAVDISDEESVRRLVERIVRAAGGIDVFISNAGVLKAGSVKELSAADFEFVTKVNYSGYFLCVKWASQVMARQNEASGHYYSDIIQINSKSGLEGSNKNGAYAGSKFGGIGLSQSFALELVGDNIKVNAVCPGNFFEGPLWSDPDRGLFVQYLRAGKVPGARSVADVKRYYEGRVPMGRGCSGADVVKAIFYAIEQRYETGQAIPVTGGQVMLS